MSTIDLDVVFNDISSRFFVNLPEEDLKDFDRLFFQLQEASWFYSDFYSQRYNLPKLSSKAFCCRFFQFSPFLRPYVDRFEELHARFWYYVGQVPVCGCILLSPSLEKCLMVKGFNCSSWTFPKGKINKNETDVECAIREVFEEVDFDARDKIDPKNVIQARQKDKIVRLFIIPNVDEETEFRTRTRFEISDISWHSVSRLPTYPFAFETGKDKFYAVRQFSSKLRRWIKAYSKNQEILDDPCPNQLPKRLKFIQPKQNSEKKSQKKTKKILTRNNKSKTSTYLQKNLDFLDFRFDRAEILKCLSFG